MVKKTDKDMTDQEMGMMYLKAAHSVRIYIYKWVLTDPSPNNFHLKNLWRVGQVAVHRGQTRASVLRNRLRNYMYPRNTDLPSQVAKTDAKGFKIFADSLEVIEVIEEPSLPVVTARMTPIGQLPRVRAHVRADEAEIRHIAELGVWRGFDAPEPWRQRLNVSAGGQGDEWERIRSEVLREVRLRRPRPDHLRCRPVADNARLQVCQVRPRAPPLSAHFDRWHPFRNHPHPVPEYLLVTFEYKYLLVSGEPAPEGEGGDG